MQWRGRRQSSNVEDRRGVPGKALAGGGLGLGGLLVIGVVWLLGGNVQQAANVVQRGGGGAGGNVVAEGERASTGEDDAAMDFVQVVLASTEDVWNPLFAEQYPRGYEEPPLVLFAANQQVDTGGCGVAGAGVGPFYCPASRQVFLCPQFFSQLQNDLGAPGDFACAYVIAHEVGHHVQNLLGYSDRVNRIRQSSTQEEANRASVRLELQADYLAGVWAHHARQENGFIDSSDVEEALNAAARIGDDTLQREATGTVNPEGFTHGTSAQRVRWFREGLNTGDLSVLDLFFDAPYGRL